MGGLVVEEEAEVVAEAVEAMDGINEETVMTIHKAMETTTTVDMETMTTAVITARDGATTIKDMATTIKAMDMDQVMVMVMITVAGAMAMTKINSKTVTTGSHNHPGVVVETVMEEAIILTADT